MPLLFMISVVIQVLLAVHVVRSGRDRYWVFIVILFPLAGCLFYVVMAVIPDALTSRSTAKVIRSVKNRVNPDGSLKQLKEELLISETSQNYLAVANEYCRLGQYHSAVEHFQKALSGIFSGDEKIMYQLAQAQYAAGDACGCVDTIDRVSRDKTRYQSANNQPRFQSQEIHLLCARALADAGNRERARREFEQLIEYYSGPQTRYYYAKMLQAEHQNRDAVAQLENIILLARRSKPHYRKYLKHCLVLAARELKSLNKTILTLPQ